MNKPHVQTEGELTTSLAKLLSLRRDLDDPDEIDRNVRSAVAIAGTNLWVLFFAILIASVGLNVNSTAVVIGAMLISPLMGPIVGIGYGLAVHDMRLIRRALWNLLVFTLLSLAASTLYFTLSPIEEFGSELLLRTTPTLWDVLIAFFGGAAGIIALTRRSISNVVPGVAIATALMPPLCTVGYGLARGDWIHAGGALYLFAINSVFIAFASLVFLRMMKLPRRSAVDSSARLRASLITGFTVLAMLLPSGYLAWRLVQEQRFVSVAKAQVARVILDERYIVLAREIDGASRRIRITIAGEAPDGDLAASIRQGLLEAGFGSTQVSVRYAGAEKIDLGRLKRDLRDDVFAQMVEETAVLRQRNTELEQELRRLRDALPDAAQLMREIRAQQPTVRSIAIGVGKEQAGSGAPPRDVTLVHVSPGSALTVTQRRRLESWLAERMPGREVRVIAR